MKLERRGDAEEPVSPSPEAAAKSTGTGGKKPVIVYILILFIVAFLLMAFSLLVHQRSNTEALGRLQSSVSAMQEVQDLQERVIELQEELAEAQKALDTAQEESSSQTQAAAEAVESSSLLRRQIDALYYLYALQQQYLLRDFDGCRETIQAMEENGMAEILADGGGAIDVTAPAVRYQELKEAVEALEG